MKKRFSHNATIQQKLVLTLLLSILTPMIIFGSIFRIYSRREFNAQTLSSIRTGFQSSINSFQDQLQLITYAERSFYSNEKVQTALSGDGHYDSIAERQAVEDYIFYLLRSINSMVTDASIIHLSAYHLSTDYYLTKNFDQYSFPLIAPEVRENVQAYSSYLEPGQYTPTHTLSVNDDIGFTICLPLYAPPSIDNSIGFLEVIIPKSRLESLCSSLYDATDSEGLLVLTEDDHVLYVAPTLTDFISRRFEGICRDYFSLQVRSGKLKGVRNIGSYYYDDPVHRKNGEFDVALELADGYAIYEAKYYAQPMTLDEIRREAQQVANIKELAVKQLGFIAINGFVEQEKPYTYLDGNDIFAGM